jgi:hypothetical protein
MSQHRNYTNFKVGVPEGGPLQMLLTPALNLLLACPKNVAAGTTFGPYRKIRKVNHLYRKFGTFNNFFAKKFCKNFTSGFLRNKHYLLAL